MSASLLRVEFETEEDFRREYASNIANGGIFVASQESFEVRGLVRVQLVLGYCDRVFEFDAEVVHWVPAEMAGAGATPGVALQFQADTAGLRAELEALARELKRRCATGGSLKRGVLEIQGDHCELLIDELRARGYNVKRAGG